MAKIQPNVAGVHFWGRAKNGNTKKCVASGDNCETSQKATVAVLENERGLKIGSLLLLEVVVLLLEV
jgi:hypothetical protein